MQYPHNPIIKALLAPFSLLYGTGVLIRNICFDWGIFTSRKFPFPVISIGNITVGGTGKTPHVEYIVSLLKDEFSVAVLSRGYKRKSSGFVVASTASEVRDIGDEPLQIKKKFPDVEVAVDGNRVRGILKLCRYNRNVNAVILDDAFQHRRVKPGIQILLIDYNRPVTGDTLLPAGRLREFASARKRAAIVIITKCPPGIKPIERRIIIKELNLFAWQSLFFTTFIYGDPVPVFTDGVPFPEREELKGMNSQILMVTGIVSPEPLKQHLSVISPVAEHLAFADHHKFKERDAGKIGRVWKSMGGELKFLITTEKDAMRFREIGNFIDPEIRINMYYIPITVSFADNGEGSFNNKILDYVGNNKRDRILY